MNFEYYYGTQADQFSFIRIPRILLLDEAFSALSLSAKVLYSVLLDRMGLSMKNKWFDKENKENRYKVLGHERILPCLCRCDREKLEAQKEEERKQDFAIKVSNLKSVGLTEPRFREWRFENDNGSTPKLDIARQYVENWKDMQQRNIGYVLMGPVGTGKSFFAGCVANRLMEQGIPVMMTNFSRILNELTKPYADKNEFISHLVSYPLLIIDDLGIERNSEFALEMIYNIIDRRYCIKKPLIVTTSIDELLGVVNEESAMEIEISKIHPFKNHPFKVLDDEKMQDLVESVKINGVLTPVLLRMDENEEYEMVSGHRRMHAAQLAGLTTIPAIVRELSDDDAIVAMVDANIQREELLPSEKAFAYKMKLAAMKRQAGRPKSNSGQNDQNLIGTVSRDVLAEQVGESSKQIQRYIRLTELIPELLDLVDNKKLQFTVAVDISYIDKEVQGWIYEYICDTGFIKPKQIAALRNQLNDGPINQIQMLSIFNNCVMAKKVSRSLTFSEKKLTKYFPDDYTAKDMEQVIESLLEKWMQEQSC